jgi:ubiquinone/menaquinone biosynthesis C-methylase UbiE
MILSIHIGVITSSGSSRTRNKKILETMMRRHPRPRQINAATATRSYVTNVSKNRHLVHFLGEKRGVTTTSIRESSLFLFGSCYQQRNRRYSSSSSTTNNKKEYNTSNALKESASQSPPPSIVNMKYTDEDSTKQLYSEWATKYSNDTRAMGYTMPEQVSSALKDNNIIIPNKKIKLFDAGCADGLSGLALRRSTSCDTTKLIGGDITPAMLDIARTRNCYDELHVINLNQPLSKFENNTFDIITCVGTMTYVNPDGPCLNEFIRIVKNGGHIIYTNRTDKLDNFISKVRVRNDKHVVV